MVWPGIKVESLYLCCATCPFCRTRWSNALALSKTALDMKAALQKASHVVETLHKLEKDHLKGEGLVNWKDACGVGDILKFLTGDEAKNFTEEQQSLVASLEDAKASLVSCTSSLQDTMPLLFNFLSRQWENEGVACDLDYEGCEASALHRKVFLANHDAGNLVASPVSLCMMFCRTNG